MSTWGRGQAPLALPQSARASGARSTQGSEPANNSLPAPMSVQRPPQRQTCPCTAAGPRGSAWLPGSLGPSPPRSWRVDWLGLLCYVLVVGPLLSVQRRPWPLGLAAPVGRLGWSVLFDKAAGCCALPLQGSLEEPRALRQRETPAKEIHKRGQNRSGGSQQAPDGTQMRPKLRSAEVSGGCH